MKNELLNLGKQQKSKERYMLNKLKLYGEDNV